MRTIYPKFITTLFIVLLLAVIARYTGTTTQAATGKPNHAAQLGYSPQK